MKKILLSLSLLAVLGLGFAYYLYNKPHQNIKKAEADFQMEAIALFSAFEADEASANKKYLDKIIEISGIVKEAGKAEGGILTITLEAGDMMFGVRCQLDELTEHKRVDFKEGEKVTFKGICTGMLMDVVLVRCVEV